MISSSDSCDTIGMWLLLFSVSSGILCGIISSYFFLVAGGIIVTSLVPASMLHTLRGGCIGVVAGFTIGGGLSCISASYTLGVEWAVCRVDVSFRLSKACSKILASSAIASSWVWPMGANGAKGVGFVSILVRSDVSFATRSAVERKGILI